MSISTNHEGYNLFVQGVQSDAQKWELETGFEQVGIYGLMYQAHQREVRE